MASVFRCVRRGAALKAGLARLSVGEPSRSRAIKGAPRMRRIAPRRPSAALDRSPPARRRLSKRARRDMAGYQPYHYTAGRLSDMPDHQPASVNHPLRCSGSSQLQPDARTIAVLRDELDAGCLQGCTDRRKRAMVRRPPSRLEISERGNRNLGRFCQFLPLHSEHRTRSETLFSGDIQCQLPSLTLSKYQL